MALFIFVLTTAICAEERTVTASGECGDDLTWTLYEDGELVIDGTGDMRDYEPLGYNTLKAPWLPHEDKISKLTLNNGLTSIGNYAFNVCDNIKGDLIIPDSVTRIGDYAFNDCKGFAGDLIIPDSVTTIEYEAFISCSNLKKYTLKATLHLYLKQQTIHLHLTQT